MNRKYPWKMFIFFVLMNMIIRHFYLFIPGVILSLIGIGHKTCLLLGLALLITDLIISILEQIEIRNTVLKDSDNEEFNEMMDAFYGPEGPDAFQKILDERLQNAPDLSELLDQEDAQRQEFLQSLTVYRQLKASISDGMTLDELIEAFQTMCTVSIGEPEDLLFETGTYDFTGEKLFYFTLARQFQFMDDSEYVQLRMNVLFQSTSATKRLYGVKWGKQSKGNFWCKVQRSRAYHAVKDLPIYKVEIFVEDT